MPNLQKHFRFVVPEDVVRVQLPFSEACMHMKVAGDVRYIKVLSASVQILNEDGSDFSAPITYGEAGIFTQEESLDDAGERKLYVWEVK